VTCSTSWANKTYSLC